jgi:hypothetical protein
MPRRSVRNLVCSFRTSIGLVLTKVPALVSTLCLLVSHSSYGAGVDRAEFLQLFKRLATERTFTADEIGTLTGWELQSTRFYPEHDTLDTDWLGQVDGQPVKIYASSSARGGYVIVRAEIPVRSYCIDREAMLASYGHRFYRSVVNIEDYPDESSLTEQVKANIRFFGWAPYYKFDGEVFASSVKFGFMFSECASAISILRNTKK